MRCHIRSVVRSLATILVLYAVATYAQDTTSPQSSTTLGECMNKPLPAGYTYRNPVKFAMPPQSTAYISTNIAKILLTEVIGVPTEIVETHEDVAWSRIASGELHAMLEYWPSTAVAETDKYFYDDQTIIDAGPLGIIAQSGWYMPRYVLSDVPDALFGDFSDPVVAAYFNNTVYVGDQDWLSIQYDIIAQNNFSLNVVQLPGEDQLMDLLTKTYARSDPLLFYFWSPHLLPADIQLIRVQLPNDSVYYPSQILGKVAWSGLPEYSPEMNYLVQALSLSNTVMDKLLLQLNTDSVFNVTCDWIKNNEKTWENWIRPSDYQEIPAGLQIAMWVLSGLCIAGTIFYLVVTIKYRQSKVIIAASGVFLVSMCVGGLLMFGSVVAFVSNTNVGCNVFIWALPIGFALLFGSLFAKTGRIYLLFSNKSLQLVKYTDRDVGLCVGVILLLEAVVLAVMTGLQPADYAFQTEADHEFTFCLFHLPTGATLLAFNGVVLVFGIIVSVLVGRLRLSLYNEAKYIGLAIYNFGFIVIFVVVIFLVNDLTVRYALLCCCILFITGVSLSVLFIPKISLLFRYTEEELREMNEAQLQAVIRSYTKKFASSSDKKNSTNKTATTGNNSTGTGKNVGSSFEDEMANLASNVKSMSDQIKELKAENKKLKETTSDDYRTLYEKYYHENMILKNQLFEFKRRYKVPVDDNEKTDAMN